MQFRLGLLKELSLQNALSEESDKFKFTTTTLLNTHAKGFDKPLEPLAM